MNRGSVAGAVGVNDGSVTLEYCTFIENYANSQGSAVYSYSQECDTEIFIKNCTFHNNEANVNSGAVHQGTGNIEIENTIITGSIDGPAVSVYSFVPSRLSIRYCNFWDNEDGDWVGAAGNYAEQDGNIHADPMYVDETNRDFHLDYDSPCLDAGDPESPNDPDGSRANIGAWDCPVVPDYMMDVDVLKYAGVCSAGDSITYSFTVMARGQVNDVYDITYRSLLPYNWSVEYITPDGRFDRESSLNVQTGETYTIDVVVHTLESDPCEEGTLEFEITSRGDENVRGIAEFYSCSAGDIFIINGDPNENFIDYYTDAVALSIYYDLEVEPTYSTWSLSDYVLDTVDLERLNSRLVIWHMGNSDFISEEHQEALIDYMMDGHYLFLSGAYAPTALYGTSLMQMLGGTYQNGFTPQNFVIGNDEDPVSDGLVLNITGGDGADTGFNSQAMRLAGEGIQIFHYNSENVAGIRVDTDYYKSIVFSFPFEAISRQDLRTELMTNMLLHFGFTPDAVDPVEDILIPETIELCQNYPNPFNSHTRIRFGLPESDHITLAVYNMLGQKVAVLANGDFNAGYHTLDFKNENLASGLYYYHLVAGSQITTRSMMFVK